MELNDFTDDEKLFRAVRPWNMYWSKKTNRPSAAAFKTKNEGLSVERGYHRNDAAVVAEMQNNFEGHIISVSVGQCKNVMRLLSISLRAEVFIIQKYIKIMKPKY